MARPERNTVDYYPHMVGEGKKMFFIENKYGNDGYATWHKILEKLCTTENHFLNLNEEQEVMFLAAKCRVSEDTLLNIINDLAKMGAFDKTLWGVKVIWCQLFIDSIHDAYNRRNNNCMTLSSLCSHLADLGMLKTQLKSKKSDNKPQSILEDSIVDNTKELYREFKHLKISIQEVNKLKEMGYHISQIDGILNSIENYSKNKNYTSLYLTAIKWLAKEYPNKSTSSLSDLDDRDEQILPPILRAAR